MLDFLVDAFLIIFLVVYIVGWYRYILLRKESANNSEIKHDLRWSMFVLISPVFIIVLEYFLFLNVVFLTDGSHIKILNHPMLVAFFLNPFAIPIIHFLGYIKIRHSIRNPFGLNALTSVGCGSLLFYLVLVSNGQLEF
jgi:hypothetical protein